MAAIAGSFLGLLIGGLLAPVAWRLVFLVCVPFGVFGTIWAYLKLVDNGERVRAKIDWAGNLTFAVGLIAVLTGIVYGIQPYGGHTMGWTNPFVLGAIFGGLVLLAVFVGIEITTDDPMFRLHLFRIRAFTAGNVASLLGALGRGGLQFMLIIWLQGIWLPQHGYSFERTPLWAGIYMVPLTVGFLVAGPLAGVLSDRYGARAFASGGMLGAAAAFVMLELLPIDFGYTWFALALLLMGLSMGMFASPNRAAVMNSLPPDQRGAGAGMVSTFQNAAQVLSIGVFFTVITLGLASSLPAHLYGGLVAQGVPAGTAHQVAELAAGREPVRRLPRLQPDSAACPGQRAGPPARGPRRLLNGSQLLSKRDQSGVQDRAGVRLRLRHRLLGHRRRGVSAPGRPLHPRAGRADRAPGGGRPPGS